MNSETGDSYVALHDACRAGEVEEVKRILSGQSNLTAKGGIVRAAVESRNAELVRFLFQNGAGHDGWEYTGDSDDFEQYWESSLITACHRGPVETVRVLIEYGADVNEVGNRGETPLGTAALHGKADICEVLLEHGAKTDGRFESGRSLLHRAAMSGNTQTLEALLPHFRHLILSEPDEYGNTPLHHAVRTPEVGPTDVLLREGADAYAVNKSGDTPLHLAAERGYPELVTLLTDHGASVNTKNSRGRTPLDVAIASRRYEVRSQRSPDANGRYDEVLTILKSHGGRYNLWRKLSDDLRRS